MEPVFVRPLPLDDEDDDLDILQIPEEDEIEPINESLLASLRELSSMIHSFKKRLFSDIVSYDKDHTADDLGAMMQFHSIWIQMIGVWIGYLDGRMSSVPNFPSSKHADTFEEITNTIRSLIKTMDGRTLVYSMLFNMSIEHPFNLQDTEDK
jgi:hypothetical protein